VAVCSRRETLGRLCIEEDQPARTQTPSASEEIVENSPEMHALRAWTKGSVRVRTGGFAGKLLAGLLV